jgi:hypothetical protein
LKGPRIYRYPILTWKIKWTYMTWKIKAWIAPNKCQEPHILDEEIEGFGNYKQRHELRMKYSQT